MDRCQWDQDLGGSLRAALRYQGAQPRTGLHCHVSWHSGGKFIRRMNRNIMPRYKALDCFFFLFSICHSSHHKHMLLPSDRKPVGSFFLASRGSLQELPGGPHLQVQKPDRGPEVPVGLMGARACAHLISAPSARHPQFSHFVFHDRHRVKSGRKSFSFQSKEPGELAFLSPPRGRSQGTEGFEQCSADVSCRDRPFFTIQ